MSNYAADTYCFNKTITKSMDTYAPQSNQHEIYIGETAASGAKISHQPVSEYPTSFQGNIAPSWGSDLANKILINLMQAQTQDVGDIMAEQVIQFFIWNTYLTDKSCTEITETDTTGLSLDDPTPTFTIHPLKDAEYDLTITMVGPPQINAWYEWNFGESYAPAINIVGSRIRLLPIKHNWTNTMKIGYSLNTIISTTKKLYEQRRPVYPDARREITVSELHTTPMIRNLLSSLANCYFGIPVITEPITPTAGQAALNTLMTINVDETLTNYYNMQKADRIVIWNDSTDETEVLQVASLGATSINLLYPSLKTWNLNNCTIYPMVMCIVNEVGMSNITDGVYETQLRVTEFIGT